MKNYENRIVLFLDMLGFKRIVGDTIFKTKEAEEEEVVAKTSFLIETIKEMTEIAQKTPKETSKVVTQFSDSIVISFNADDQKEIPRMFYNLQRLIAKLISREVLCRGAILCVFKLKRNNSG
jgi:hypothetical protein